MKWRIARVVAPLLALWRSLWWVHGLPGNPNAFPPQPAGQPLDAGDLRDEMRHLQAEKRIKGDLPESVYTVFQTAVDHHLHSRYHQARIEYGKLHHIPRAFGFSFDLASISEVYRHNLRLLVGK